MQTETQSVPLDEALALDLGGDLIERIAAGTLSIEQAVRASVRLLAGMLVIADEIEPGAGRIHRAAIIEALQRQAQRGVN